MRLVRRQPGLSFLGCVILAKVSLWIVDQMTWSRWTFLAVYGLLALVFDFSLRLSDKRPDLPLGTLMLLSLPAYAVVLILQDPLFRWVLIPVLALGLAFALYLRHREKSPAIG